MSRKSYTKEFKLQAARLVVEQGYTYRQVSDRLGPSAWTIRDWVKKLKASGEIRSDASTESAAEELKKLRKEHAELQMENQILKKAAAYFAKENL